MVASHPNQLLGCHQCHTPVDQLAMAEACGFIHYSQCLGSTDGDRNMSNDLKACKTQTFFFLVQACAACMASVPSRFQHIPTFQRLVLGFVVVTTPSAQSLEPPINTSGYVPHRDRSRFIAA